MAAIGFLCSTPAEAVAHYRAGVPGRILRARGHTVVVSDQGQLTPAGTCALLLEGGRAGWEPDVVILTGGWASGVPLELIDEARANGQVVIVDVDDWPWIPPSNPHYNPELAAAKLAAINRADALVCSTPAIANGLRDRVTPPVYVARNAIDPEPYEVARALNDARASRYDNAEENPEPLVVGYRGGVAFHEADLAVLRGVLELVTALEVPLRFVHVGHVDGAPTFADALGIDPAVVELRPMVTFSDYAPLLVGVDVALVPLGRVPFSLAKSNVAGLEWAAAGVPFLASEHPEYRAFTGGIPGTLAGKPRAWRGCLRELIANPMHRYSVRATQRATLEGVATATDPAWRLEDRVRADVEPYEVVLGALGVQAARVRVCRECGCTDERACEGGCSWAELEPPLCSRCAERGSAPGVSPGAPRANRRGAPHGDPQGSPQPGGNCK